MAKQRRTQTKRVATSKPAKRVATSKQTRRVATSKQAKIGAAKKELAERSTQLNKTQTRVVGSHFKNIANEVKKMQEYLDGIGVRPLGGWRDPFKYRLVQGLDLSDNATAACTECSVVCFDGGCDCQECNNPKELLPDARATITVGPGIVFHSLEKPATLRVRVERTGTLSGG